MAITIVEIKARCVDPAGFRAILESRNARFVGVDEQRDTYFHVLQGRLKLREGTIENALIQYSRPDEMGPKRSDVLLYATRPDTSLKSILARALGIDVVVDKKRQIYFIGNIKFHIDEVDGLGTFVEIEAIDEYGSIGFETLRRQCDEYLRAFEIREEDLISESYCDLLRREITAPNPPDPY